MQNFPKRGGCGNNKFKKCNYFSPKNLYLYTLYSKLDQKIKNNLTYNALRAYRKITITILLTKNKNITRQILYYIKRLTNC